MIDKSLFELPGVHKMLAALLVSALLQAAFVLGQACSLSAAIVNMWNGEAAFAQAGLLGVFFSCYLGRQLVLFAQQHLLDSFAQKRAAELRRHLLQSIFLSRTRVVRENGTAAVTASMLEGSDQVETYLKLVLPKMVEMAAMPLVILVAAFTLDWVSGVILLVMFPVIIFFMILLGRTAKAKAQAQYGTYQQLSNHFIDTLRGIDTLAAFGASKRERGRIWQVSERFRRATVDTLKVATLSGAVLDVCTVFGIGAVAIMLGLRLADHSIALATALPILVMAPDYFKPIRSFASDFHASLDGKNALADIMRMIGGARNADDDAMTSRDTRTTINLTNAVDQDSPTRSQASMRSCAAQPLDVASDSAISPWNPDSTLELCDVSFGYEPERQALEDISLQVQGFAKIGIVGASGAGKSTLANLLGGFWKPRSGSICVNGEPVSHLGFDGWQHQVLFIPQDPYIFHDTLRANIAFYTPDATDEEIANAVDVVGLQALVDELPRGLDTVIGEGGRGLSGGQAQRIALARVLLDHTRKILVFDEPTAHLDIETELELKRRMLPLMEDHLVLFATHRLHWLHDMDHVLVMEQGRIVEQGRPDELLADEGKLADLAHRMNTGFEASMAQPFGKAPEKAEMPDGAESTAANMTSKPVLSRNDTGFDSFQQHAREAAKNGIAADATSSPAKRQPCPKPETTRADRKTSLKRWVRPYIGRYRKQLAYALVLGLATFACSALLMFTAGFLISWTADPALPTLAAAMYAIGLVQIFGLGKPIARYIERLVSHDWVFRMTSSLRVRLYGILEAQAMHVRKDHQMGEFLSLVVDDIGHLQNLFLRTLFPVTIAGMLYLAVSGIFGIFDPRFGLFIFVATGLCVVAMPAIANRVNREAVHELKWRRGELYRQLTDNVLGAADWVFSGRSDEYLRRCETGQQEEHELQRRLDRYDHANDLVLAAVFGACVVAVTLWAGASFASGHVGGSSNWIAAFALGFFPLIEAFGPVSNAVAQAETHSESIDRLGALPTKGDDDHENLAEGDIPHGPAGHKALRIDLENVTFAYAESARNAIDDVTIHIPAGQKVAILGRSGAGKSTLAQVLRGDLKVAAGSVCIDGESVANMADTMHERVGIVQQQTYLFNRTLRENLALARPDVDDEELWEALRQVHMDDVARRLPQGLDTVLDEAGSQFSGGERHRLAFARVLLAHVPIVLLDEPMVGLDPAIEHELLDTLLCACADKTLVLITHHLQDIARFDRVVFVEDGRIELDGSPAKLVATSERFCSLLAFDSGAC